jgi:hypothetical protein
MSAWASALRWAVLTLLTCTLALGVITTRVISDGNEERFAGDKAFDQGDLATALVHARRAATLYAPGAPHVRLAYERMVAIALGSERKGDSELALSAWRAIRSAILETRHIWIVEPELLAMANGNLARLMTRGTSAEARAEAQSWLDRDEAPRAEWVFVLGFGFAATMGGLGWICLRGVSSEGKVRFARIKWAGVLTLIGLACWTLAVLRA